MAITESEINSWPERVLPHVVAHYVNICSKGIPISSRLLSESTDLHYTRVAYALDVLVQDKLVKKVGGEGRYSLWAPTAKAIKLHLFRPGEVVNYGPNAVKAKVVQSVHGFHFGAYVVELHGKLVAVYCRELSR